MADDATIRAVVHPKVEVALGEAVAALKKARVSFALVGGLALDHYVEEPRVTRDVDFIVAAGQWKKAVKAIQGAGFVHGDVDEYLTQLSNDDKVRIDLLFGVGDPEESARELAVTARVLGVEVRIAKPEFLVWMYMLSNQPRHQEDAERLVAQGIDFVRLGKYLKMAGAKEELHTLAKMIARERGARDQGRVRGRIEAKRRPRK